MKIISLDDLKGRVDFDKDPTEEELSILDQLIDGYSYLFEDEIHRELEKVERVEEFPGTYCTLWLKAPPVDPDAALEVREIPVTGSERVLTASTHYLVRADRAAIYLANSVSPNSSKIYRVTYTGGFPHAVEAPPPAWAEGVDYQEGDKTTQGERYYIANADHTSAAGDVADGAPDQANAIRWDSYTLEVYDYLDFSSNKGLGETLRQAMLDQISVHWNRRDSLDAVSVSVGPAGESIARPATLLPTVRRILQNNRREI